MVEHLATGEKQHSDQADCSPEVPVLNNREHIGRQDCEHGHGGHQGGDYRHDTHVVDGANNLWLSAFGEVTSNPSIDLLGGYRAMVVGQISRKVWTWEFRLATHPVKSNRTGFPSTFACGPIVGGNTSRTGAVWSMSCSGQSTSHSSDSISGSYLLEDSLAIIKVKGTEDHLEVIRLGSLIPAPSN